MAQLKVTYKKSTIGYAHDQKRTVASLGLRKLNQSVILPDNPAVRGMVFKVRHLVSVEEIAGDPTPEATPRRRARTYGTGGAL
jgi:large subunit ribosomal protein L30